MKRATDHAQMQHDNPEMATRILENGTKIVMHFGDTAVPATLNDSITAQALLKQLPLTIRLSNYGQDFCGVMAHPLPYNDDDVHNGWLNGDVDFATDGNWFTILYAGEDASESYGYQVNIGKIDCPLARVGDIQGSVDVRIELAD